MLTLTDAEMGAVYELAQPLLPAQRGAFLEALAAELRGGEIGVGRIHRIGSRLQGQFLRTVTGPAE